MTTTQIEDALKMFCAMADVPGHVTTGDVTFQAFHTVPDRWNASFYGSKGEGANPILFSASNCPGASPGDALVYAYKAYKAESIAYLAEQAEEGTE